MDDISDKVAVAVSSTLDPGTLSRVVVEPAIDSDGQDAWSVLIVLNNENVTGDQALHLIAAVDKTFEGLGDDSISIVSFATEDELKADVGSEA